MHYWDIKLKALVDKATDANHAKVLTLCEHISNINQDIKKCMVKKYLEQV